MKDLTKNNRLNEKERRDFDSSQSLAAETLERRKRPDRRMGGMDVQVVANFLEDTSHINFHSHIHIDTVESCAFE